MQFKKMFINFLVLLIITLPKLTCAIEIDGYYGRYIASEKKPGRASASLQNPIPEVWETPKIPGKIFKIGVLVPHLKDKYWLAVNYGLIEQAKLLGVNLKVYSAGGYSKGGVQKKQLTDEILQDSIEGIILSTIYYDKLDRFITQINDLGIPIIGLINDILAPSIKGKVMISHYDIGYEVGKYVIRDSKGADIRIAFFPGPKQSQWAPDTLDGFVHAIQENPEANSLGKVTIVAKPFGSATQNVQSKLVELVINEKDNIDYLIGNAATALVAPSITFSQRSKHPNLKIIATYLTPDLYDSISKRFIYAAASDFMVYQAKISMDMMVRILSGEEPGIEADKLPFRISPKIKIIDKDNLKNYPYEDLLGAKDFRPLFRYIPQ